MSFILLLLFILGAVQTVTAWAFDNAGNAMAAVVIDSAPAANPNANTGARFLACFGATKSNNLTDNGSSDDWIISPLLEKVIPGASLKFWARNLPDCDVNATFRVMASSTGNSKANFAELAEKQTVTNKWEEYVYDIPEGTKYMLLITQQVD